ncbi:MAG TPA: family 78 glycoside hydrolase catalytic domain [Candidatus Hydrogenedentes bacterium]|nr:family 78 glycoside hydrolase catalytic domain [Candidatus Hydrogenedentota bacterium]HPG65572.1 family 78 glycoside hydrolase catalytic domain [Candidatus Hydrogenedentota bacterium]
MRIGRWNLRRVRLDGIAWLLVAFGPCLVQASQATPTVAEVSCEYAVNPLGLDTPRPRFSWVLDSDRRGMIQRAYQVLVASLPERLAEDSGDLWDSGKVPSDESVNVEYRGKKLASRQSCCWKVRVWDDVGEVSPWSAPATFEMGLLDPSDWHGRWIGLAGEEAAAVSPLLRKEFAVAGPVKRARLYAAGIGWSEYYLNGKRIGDHVLDPAATDYDKRIFYVVHDVTDLLHSGPNVLGAMLGNGWFSEPPGPNYADSPCLLLELVVELADGTIQQIPSDERWRASTGPIVKNNLFGGEVYDARLEKAGWLEPGYDDSAWAAAAIREDPGGRLEAQRIEPMKVNEILQPVKLTCPDAGVYVFDFGRLFGGWARLRVQGPAGTEVALKYAERTFPDTGLVDKRRHLLAPDGATDFYILKGDPGGERYEPRFTFHPLRYVQVEGLPSEPSASDLEGCAVFSSVDMTGDFRCSNALLNQIHRHCVWTFANALYGMELDCLYREHWSWLEPASDPSILFTRKHIPRFVTKHLGDAQYAQHPDGVIPDVIPAYPLKGRKTGDPAWAGNYPLVVWYAYQYYGDRRLLEDHYPCMKRWVDYLGTLAEDNVIETGGYYGDHMLPGDAPGHEEFISKETPPPLLWTGYYYRNAWILAQAAKILGKPEDAEAYGRMAEAIRTALNAKWLDASGNRYATGSQTSTIFPLALGIVPEADRQGVLDGLVEDILVKRCGHLHTGNLGTACIMDALPALGRGDILYRVATATDYPGWGYMVEQGATTIWECWGGLAPGKPENMTNGVVVSEDSMPMFVSMEEFFYGALAGIEGPAYHGPRAVAPGFREIRIRPCVPGDLTSVTAHIRTVRGIVGVDWKRAGDGLSLNATIPANARARISIPTIGLRQVRIEESGRPLWEEGTYHAGVPGISAASEDSEYVTFDTGSGTYALILRGVP